MLTFIIYQEASTINLNALDWNLYIAHTSLKISRNYSNINDPTKQSKITPWKIKEKKRRKKKFTSTSKPNLYFRPLWKTGCLSARNLPLRAGARAGTAKLVNHNKPYRLLTISFMRRGAVHRGCCTERACTLHGNRPRAAIYIQPGPA